MYNNTLTLNNGAKIPQLGLGTWFIDDAKVADAVKEAVKLGYRHIDTAQAYGNERGVGEGVRTCGVPREELFVVSKVAAENKTYEQAKAGNREAWRTLEEAYKEGKLKAIGISNFQISDIESLVKIAEIKEMADKYGVTVQQLCIRYTIQLGAVSLPKTGNAEHMKSNAQVDFEISAEDMEVLKNFKKIENYGESSGFPVYGGKL